MADPSCLGEKNGFELGLKSHEIRDEVKQSSNIGLIKHQKTKIYHRSLSEKGLPSLEGKM